jgi:hypothetical protein
MDVSALVSILAPCLGVLLAGANAAAEEIGKSLAPDLIAHAKRIWAKLKPHVEAKPAALEAAGDLARRPADDRARGAFELQLEKLLDDRAGLTEELQPLLNDAAAAGVIALGDRAVAVGGSMSGGVIVTGDNAVIRE